MSIGSVSHSTLLHLTDAGVVSSAIASAKGDIWTLIVVCGDKNKIMMAKNSGKPRIWRKLDTLAKYLKSVGIEKFEIDATSYNPDQKSLRRPDSSATLKKTHQAHKSQSIGTLIKPEKNGELTKTQEQTREKWEERRARILAEENPRVE